MLSIRSFARAAPRACSRIASTAIFRPARPTSLLQSAFKPARTQFASAFSTSQFRRKAEGDEELIAKLESEIGMENDLKDDNGEIPTSVKDYLENGPFEVIDTPGNEEVVLTRTFGDEKIRVSFSIADLNALDPEADYQDRAMADEDDEGKKITSEDGVDGEESEGESDNDSSWPARLQVTIEKPGKGAIVVEAAVQDGMVVIDNVYHYADASHAYAKSADKVHERQDLYAGPPFSNLDEDLQSMFERYLDERGINTVLAVFVPDYIDMKEQKEYLRWLENVKDFVDA